MYPALALPPAALAPAVDALAEAGAAFGVNFIVPMMDPASLELALERAPYVDFFLDDADPALVERVHAAGAVCGWQVETAEEARAAEAAGCDVVIAKAWESGGRKRVEGPTLLPLLDAVLDAVALPVVAAGGIATARGVAAALAAGASGRARRHALHRRRRVRRPPGLGRGGAGCRGHRRRRQRRLQRRPRPARPAPRAAERARRGRDAPGRDGRDAPPRGRRDPRRPASARSRRPATPPARSPRWRSTPASRPAPSARSRPPPRSSRSSRGVCPFGR